MTLSESSFSLQALTTQQARHCIAAPVHDSLTLLPTHVLSVRALLAFLARRRLCSLGRWRRRAHDLRRGWRRRAVDHRRRRRWRPMDVLLLLMLQALLRRRRPRRWSTGRRTTTLLTPFEISLG